MAANEENCAELKPMCADGSTDLLPSLICDGRDDCEDGSDEEDCGWGEFTCDDGTVIAGHRRCDADVDCPDGSDQSGCVSVMCPDENVTELMSLRI